MITFKEWWTKFAFEGIGRKNIDDAELMELQAAKAAWYAAMKESRIEIEALKAQLRTAMTFIRGRP